ncbi:MAG: aminodeoxychorismate/anthranilate synthase component II [Anaerolineae bacterium]|jgi:anthranilate synthase/aminodeoxychorismate synthase-like glutamine amidotransferase|nr:aminodeoxychorismate/anthranilate synthase component II [Anaerolineae bacterium]
MILVIDNYDSFTYNLVQELGELGAELHVVRNDQITLDDIRQMNPSHIVISPGPGTPDDSGVSLEVIKTFGPTVPLLGVCLGHQSIGQVFGGVVKRAPKLMHGKTSRITHNGEGIFAGLSQDFQATRYHSLIVEAATLPDVLEVTARSEDGEIMGLRHKQYPIVGVQFHPESILTPEGMTMLKNFLAMTPVSEPVTA